MYLDIIFEDNHLLVVNKPAGILTQPSGTEQASLENYAKEFIKHKYQKAGNVFLSAIHRLDKPVSGIVLFGKTSKAVQRLNAAMREKKSKKIYLCIVSGNLNEKQGILEHHLSHESYHAQIVEASNEEGKLSRLQYKVLKENSMFSLIQIELETGRYHQIRIQLSTIGHPILGDKKYRSQVNYRPEEIALHHWKLTIPHPVTSELKTFVSDVPDHWPLRTDANM